MAVVFKIHPAIGVARVGDSEEFYLAPETEGGLPILPDGKPFEPSDFRDAAKRLRRQGARFTVFRYDDSRPGDPGTPVLAGSGGVQRIEWTVHLANKKASWYQFKVLDGEFGYSPNHPLRNATVTDPAAREALIIDPGPRSLRRPNGRVEFSRGDNPDDYPMTFPPESLEPFTIDSLGGLRTDEEGRLIVLGGYGRSGSSILPPTITDYANNDGWFDDVSDGPVTARLVMDDDRPVEVEASAWVLVTPPKFAPELVNLVTLWDSIFDTSVRRMGLCPDIYRDSLWQFDYVPSWPSEVRPILERAHLYPWVVKIPAGAHDFDFEKLGNPDPKYDPMRQFLFGILRAPNAPNVFGDPKGQEVFMPFLCGDNCFEPAPLISNYQTLTDTQYFFLMQWAQGKFSVEPRPPLPAGEELDRAALENCVGAAYSPGIEMTWVSRNPAIYAAPFRLKRRPDVEPPLSLGGSFAAGLEPGDVSRYMAQPWQADFNECSTESVKDIASGESSLLFWWPVERPLMVMVKDGKRLEQAAWVGQMSDPSAPDYLQFKDDIDMVARWKELGFVFNEGTDQKPCFVEVDRVLPRPPGTGGG